jgi:hypothetical protein
MRENILVDFELTHKLLCYSFVVYYLHCVCFFINVISWYTNKYTFNRSVSVTECQDI